MREEIRNLSTDVNKIIDFVMTGADRGVTYDELALFIDKFGPRHLGTANLENSIDYMLDRLTREGHDIVGSEKLVVPIWQRGKEWAQMVSPRAKKLNIMGLGYSVGTNGRVLSGDVVVVKSFDDLHKRSHEVKGKFVVFNYAYETYSTSVSYRINGASEAAKYGAIAALIRSVTDFSIDSPHTGAQEYKYKNVPNIPAVSITVEDAEFFSRLCARGETVRVSLYMEARMDGTGVSRNTISEITGSHYADEMVIVSGHLDSWDVGSGAMDDGGGCFASWRALSVLKKLGLRPKRTIRSILWTGEEMGLLGAKAYVNEHKHELHKISLAMESDEGTFSPHGLTYSGSNPIGKCIMSEILKMLAPLNATNLYPETKGPDIGELMQKGVPGSHIQTHNEHYFYFHHTNGDTMTVEDTDELDRNTAVIAATAYAVASIDVMLPR
ncbi:unnamed protein product [Medioppia subpectinata]|uniref:Carboxypeptidase Q n=1 Tax=Medioppia subpectinata TaxID=1979941 RepID=A0A7R9L425_9ACAR|nr:unnamed protein product [Medioppia subpectinata]CAG2114029.1 unnamed protein product [Medioppia subpectinata]